MSWLGRSDLISGLEQVQYGKPVLASLTGRAEQIALPWRANSRLYAHWIKVNGGVCVRMC